jgi:MFS-type transporter involved in bile tolerance (Atg22 family)
MAGNLGGTGVGGALALWLAQHLSATTTSAVLAGFCLVCALPALSLHEAKPERHALGRAMVHLVKDVWATVKSRPGWTGILICLSPVGTGAATQLFSAVAGDYKAGETHVELVNGVLGGLVGALGCLLGGVLADRMNRRLCYVLAGALTAVTAIGMALAPATPTGFTVGCLAYQFANGIAYAAFAAFVLEMVGHGAGVTTKYALFVGCSNQAISYVTWADGKGYDTGAAHGFSGRVGMLGMDAAATAVGIAILGAVFLYLRRVDRRSPASPAVAPT